MHEYKTTAITVAKTIGVYETATNAGKQNGKRRSYASYMRQKSVVDEIFCLSTGVYSNLYFYST